MKQLRRSQINRITIYLISVSIFVISVFAVAGFKVSFKKYYEDTYETYKNARWDIVEEEIISAIELGKSGLINASNNIQTEINQLDTDDILHLIRS